MNGKGVKSLSVLYKERMSNTFLSATVVTPGSLLITNITRALRMVVTITNADTNTYQVNQMVHLTVPYTYGMIQADQKTGKILSIDGLNFTLDIDSTSFDPFVTTTDYQLQPASLSPAGSRNLEFSNTTTFVPFKSLNNRGN